MTNYEYFNKGFYNKVSYGKITLIELKIDIKGKKFLVMKIFDGQEDITHTYSRLESKLNINYLYNDNFNYEEEKKGYFYTKFTENNSILKDNSALFLKELKGDISGIAFLFAKNNYFIAAEFNMALFKEIIKKGFIDDLYKNLHKVKEEKYLQSEIARCIDKKFMKDFLDSLFISEDTYKYYHESFMDELFKVSLNLVFNNKLSKKSFLMELIRSVKFYHNHFNSRVLEKFYDNDDFKEFELDKKSSSGGVRVRVRKLKP